ncbi:MAG: endonuclease domain-containing protein [bacterium]|nr:endonuclease domain-containing protein [bacterium]
MKVYNQLKLKTLRRKLRRDSTETERLVWNLIRNRQIMSMKFFRQYSIGTYIVDFYCPEIELAIEIDGGQHNESRNVMKDNQRTDYLEKIGIEVLRFWNNEIIENTEGVYEETVKTIKKLLPTSSLEKRRNSLSFTKRGLG